MEKLSKDEVIRLTQLNKMAKRGDAKYGRCNCNAEM